jgi:hemoglobin
MADSDYEALGGYEGVAAIMDEFVNRIFADMMIGFHFRDASREDVARFEIQFACGFLGGPEIYEGRSMDATHARHPITGGQFMRRLRILRDVLEERKISEDIIARWVAHNEALRPMITGDVGSACNHRPGHPAL